MGLLLLAILSFVAQVAVGKGIKRCSEKAIPDLDGMWVCTDDWILRTQEQANSIEGTKSWLITYITPTFYAISKIRTVPRCNGEEQIVLHLSAAVWDEADPEGTMESDINPDGSTALNMIEFDVPKLTFMDDDSQMYSGFARRSPYWRIQLDMIDTVNRSCVPSLEFYARAGVAATQHFFMTIESAMQADVSLDWNQESPPLTDTCKTVERVPPNVVRKYRLDTSFYYKYTSAYGIPILSSRVVNDRALQRACYVVRFMLADRADIRYHMYNNKGRVAIIGRRQTVPMVPEMRIFPTFTSRAAGGTFQIPVNVGAEENMLCESGDRYAKNQDIFMHEFAHGVHLIACYTALPSFNTDLQRAFLSARRRGLWRNTYANTNNKEYFAEGIQAFFNQQREGPVGGDGIQNHIDTREELRSYDPALYNIVNDLFPCSNEYIPRCQDIRQTRSLNQVMSTNCKGGGVTSTKTTTTTTTKRTGECTDDNSMCVSWARTGECTKNPDYMLVNCKQSCQQCSTGPKTSTTSPTKTTEPTPPTTETPTTTLNSTVSVKPSTTTPASTTTTSVPTTCHDENNRCSDWAGKGECQKNPLYMLDKCKKSCNQCGHGNCRDLDGNCRHWGAYCWSNQYVRANCKKICRRC